MEGIAYLHSKDLVYVDLKPENVLVGDDQRLALIDFGLSCFTKDLPHFTGGTFDYLSPERAVAIFELTNSGLDKSLVGPSTDVWSAGCIFWWMFHPGGGYPWLSDCSLASQRQTAKERKDDMVEALKKMRLFDKQKPLREDAVDFIIWKMLRYRPEDRWTPGEVIKALKSLNRLFSTFVHQRNCSSDNSSI